MAIHIQKSVRLMDDSDTQVVDEIDMGICPLSKYLIFNRATLYKVRWKAPISKSTKIVTEDCFSLEVHHPA